MASGLLAKNKGLDMNRIDYKAAVIARINFLIAEHGESTEDRWVPFIRDVTPECAWQYWSVPCKEIKASVSNGWIVGLLAGEICGEMFRDILVLADPAASAEHTRWKAFCDVFGTKSRSLETNGKRVGKFELMWREVNLGAINRLKEDAKRSKKAR